MQSAIVIYPAILPFVFTFFSSSQSATVRWFGSNVAFPFLPIIAGFIGGVQFPLANKICLTRQREIGEIAGLSYGMDLVGSCLGALLTAALLVPLLGIYQTCILCVLVNLSVLLLLRVGFMKLKKGK